MDDQYFMKLALVEAQKAFDEEEIPIGAVVVWGNKVISRAHNQTEKLNDPTAHAEMLALTSAFNYLGAKYLMDATLFVTVEPCLMCCGALNWSKVGRIVYGVSDEKNGCFSHLKEGKGFHPKTKLEHGILEAECKLLMQTFFKKLRK